MTRAQLREAVEVGVPAGQLWRVVTDWPLQGEWIPFTTVRSTVGKGRGVGSRVEAWTGLGRVGFLDTMVVTHWSEPSKEHSDGHSEGRRVCEVLHTGRLVRGEGGFEVEPLGPSRSRLVWWESVELPLGAVGALGWRLTSRWWQAGTAKALQRLRTLAEGDGG